MGMRIGYGTSAKENTIAVMSWQEAESHIRAMVENGTYMSANEVFLVDAVERERVATDINNFFRDGISEMPESLELKFSNYPARDVYKRQVKRLQTTMRLSPQWRLPKLTLQPCRKRSERFYPLWPTDCCVLRLSLIHI